jgi:uncharacterized repeat protein (TIGR03803 family)
VTTDGGANGKGAFYRSTLTGLITILYSFGASTGDAKNPQSGVVEVGSGTFYGTSETGGTVNGGGVYSITADGTESIIHSFGDGSLALDAKYPTSPLTLGADGNLYGDTSSYVTSLNGTSTVIETSAIYKMTPEGAVAVIYRFPLMSTDVICSVANLLPLKLGADGNLYGAGMSEDGSLGNVFRISPSGTYTDVYDFTNTNTDCVGLYIDAANNIFGTTLDGGDNNFGTLFSITSSGVGSVVYSFGKGGVMTDGVSPWGDLTLGPNGMLLGETTSGGPRDLNRGFGFGVLYEYSLPLPSYAAAPVIWPAGGTFTTTQQVILTEPTPGSTIYYTVDGDVPVVGNGDTLEYTGPFNVTQSSVVQAIAVFSPADSSLNSLVSSASFFIGATIPAPTITPGSSVFVTSESVTLSDVNTAASIYYTTDGTTPTKSSTLYTGPITVLGTEKIQAIAAEDNYLTSPIASASFTQGTQLPAPTISPNGGLSVTAPTVSFSDSETGATVSYYYTTDGSVPTTNSFLYGAPFSVPSSAKVSVIAVADGWLNSPVSSVVFTLEQAAPAPVFSPSGGSYTSTQQVTITESQPGSTIYYTVDGNVPVVGNSDTFAYTGPINVAQSTTVEAIAVFPAAQSYMNSPSAFSNYVINGTLIPPTIIPGSSVFVSSESVTLSDVTPSASMYYTTDGTTPTTSSTLYTGPIMITETEQIQAIASADNYVTSLPASAQFTLAAQLPTPTISPNGGPSASAPTVSFSDAANGATVSYYYTTDSSVPSTGSTLYTAPFSVPASAKVSVIAVAPGWVNSPVASAVFTVGQAVPTPTFTPAGGQYNVAQSVTLSDALAGALIYYTTDGSAPTSGSQLYSGPITVGAAETINAIGIEAGYNDSQVAAASYTIGKLLAAPTFLPAGGTVAPGTKVTLSCAGGGSIYYTTDGTTPTSASALYTGPISIMQGGTITAIAAGIGCITSSTSSAAFSVIPTVPAPTFSLNSGTFTAAVPLTITDSLPGSTIHYTTDGTVPTSSSAAYTGPITVSGSETVRAIAVANSYENSAVTQASFTINLPVLASYGAGLQLISLPETCSNETLDTVFGYSSVRLAAWNPVSYAYAVTPTAPADSIVAGQGYWVRFPQAVTVYQQGTLAPTDAPYKISIAAGWNLVGDPFTSPVSIENVTIGTSSASFSSASSGSAPVIATTVWGYDSGANNYAQSSTLNPGAGYWVFAYSATTLNIPPPSGS